MLGGLRHPAHRRDDDRLTSLILDEARDRVAGVVRSLVAGDAEPIEATIDPGDPGLFPADSPVRQVHADASMFIGGIRALLIQSLHPPTMYAVSVHSAYREDPLGRLQRTSMFLAATTFGSGTEARQAIDIVRSVHDRVQGTMPDGTPYSARDPHQLAWVHLTEVDSFLRSHKDYGAGRLTVAQADRYVADMAETGLALGMTDAPRSVAELDAALEAFRPELATTEWSEETTLFLLNPPLPLAVRPAYAVLFGAALGSLPPWVRSKLLLPIPPGSNRLLVRPAATLLTRTLHWALSADR